ncbi:MAG: N-acetylmuramoyl-L-alanine amidase [Bacteroidales bacterium]|jgi:hypothetical protein|nr:N-acetylmuramoyl-L-alanine amidase [Bacteroidales bacterium]
MNAFFFRIVLPGIFFLSIFSLKAQYVTKIQFEPDSERHQNQLKPFKAIAFSLDTAVTPQTWLKTANKTFAILPDEHSRVENGVQMSKLIVFDQAENEFIILGKSVNQVQTAYLIHTPDLEESFSFSLQNVDSCAHPPMVMQEVWRAGLPDPDYERIPNIVRHQIIHHSATDNELTDYVNLIRSIYLYHTEVNGWSDIGYNYLISPDGILFAGRDPGETLDQDGVLGAHFCASNSGTMGICMLGTFMNQMPTSEALSTLNQLISWKAITSNLDPEGTFSHPLNPSLGTIAGHRDGCATSCPGDSLASILPQIRTHSLETLYGCGVFPGLSTLNNSSELKIFPNPSNSSTINYSSSLNFQKATLFDLLGNQHAIWHNIAKENSLQLPSNLKEGLYIIQFITKSGMVIPMKILVSE